MPIRLLRLRQLLVGGVITVANLVLPIGDSFAGAATATYRGDAPAASSAGRRIELRLRTDGTMTWITDFRNGRAPITEEGRWYPISAEEFDLIVESRDGKPVNPAVIRFVKKGDSLSTTPEAADRFGSSGLQLKQVKSATAAPSATPVTPASSPFGQWRWESQVGADTRFDVDAPERYTLDIQSGGKVLVRADCNRGSGSYKMEGRSILFKLGAFTRAACARGSHADQFLKAIESVVAQRIRGENLFLDLAGESGSLKFRRAVD